MEWLQQLLAKLQAQGLTQEQTLAAIREAVTAQGYTIRNAQEDTTYLQNNSQKAIDDAFKTRNQQLEDTIKNVTGISKKDATEKYYDYFSRAMTELKQKLQENEDKLKEVEKGGGDNVLLTEKNNQIKALQQQLQDAKKEHEQKVKELSDNMFNQKYEAGMSQVIESIKKDLRDDIDPKLLEDIIANRVRRFKEDHDAVEVEGQLVFKDKKTGTPRLNKQDGKHNNLSELLTEVFADLKKPAAGGAPAGGAGSGKPGGAPGAGGQGGQGEPAWKTAKRPETITNKVKLTDWLKNDLKLDETSKEFSEAFTTHSKLADGKELPLRN